MTKVSNDKDISDLRKVQLAQKDILDKVVEICNKNQLEYFLIGGTLIGAVRHKGFIPWDDDIDVAMKRKDYDKFIKIATKELQKPYKVVHYSTDDRYRYYLLNIENENIEITEQRVTPITHNVSIDILPIDGIPNGKIKEKIYKFKILYYRALVGFTNIDYVAVKKRSLIEKMLIKFAQIVPIGKLINRKKIRLKHDKFVRKYDYDDCNKVGTFHGNYGFHEIVPKEHFGKGSSVMFEGNKYKAPELVDEYLTHMYGDYMKLPPEEKRVGHHIIDIKIRK